MAEKKCEQCAFRAKYDRAPQSLLGRLWRWHVGWCPGWNGYMRSLPAQERARLAEKYDLKKYK
ncbi:MAG: hypothetical protein HZB87_04220 [Desulfatitalea sp.]|nr:hypothetical protein [Desulfatitalea sp.]MBI5896196.1 hypothetical protein [Desulfobacterales bacterium]